MNELRFTAGTAGHRLDKFLADRCPGTTRSQLQRLIEQGLALVNGRCAKSGQKLDAGDVVEVSLPSQERGEPAAEQIPLNVVYEDEDLLVIDKPAGIVVHPAPGHSRHTLVNALLAHCPELSSASGGLRKDRPGIVHRLDKDTSGLMVIAKSAAVRERLIHQFSSRLVHKTYLVLVDGLVTQRQGIIEGPIGRDPEDRKLMAIVEGGREARTRFHVIEHRGSHTLMEAMPETGRTHQIRVHLAAIGYPVCGDRLYGRKAPHLRRQFLHAGKLAFEHPVSGDPLEFSSPLPADLQQALMDLPCL
ncbi:MAG: RluA family pseudouridine synthase [Dehalococcoidia bacterium]|nr:RluA family pseudouridine synthase [Dehalococcoidia bacterium]